MPGDHANLDQAVQRARETLARYAEFQKNGALCHCGKCEQEAFLGNQVELATAVVEMADLRENDTECIHNLVRDLDARTAQLATARKLIKQYRQRHSKFISPMLGSEADQFMKETEGL